MDEAAFGKLFHEFKHEAFRLQCLPEYRIDAEDEDYRRYLSGETFPDREGNRWIEYLAGVARSEKKVVNVHVLPAVLTTFLRYSIEWWYPYWDRAGADVRFVLPASRPEPHREAWRDFWMFDRTLPVEMRYDPEGHFLGPVEVKDANGIATCRTVRDEAVAASVNLRELLARLRSGRFDT